MEQNVLLNKLAVAKKFVNENPDKSYGLYSQIFEEAVEKGLKNMEAEALIGLAFTARAKSERSSLLDYSFRALEVFSNMNDDEGIVRSYNLIGIGYFYSSLFDEAIRYFFKCIDLFEKFENISLKTSVYNNMGEVYRESGMYDEALREYQKALEGSINTGLNRNIAIILGNIGEVYLLKGDFEKALSFFEKSKDNTASDNDYLSIGEVHNRLGRAYFVQGLYDKAEGFFVKALECFDHISNRFYKVDVLKNLADTKSDFHEKNKLLMDAVEAALSTDAKKKLCELYKKISSLHENVFDHKTALYYYKKYCLTNEEVLASNINNRLEIIKIELNHLKETENFAKVRQRLEKELEYRRSELSKVRHDNDILEKRAYEDELTKVPNRRSLIEYISTLLNSYKGKNAYICLYVVDIDNFKDYNDYWGHSQGDECLKCIASEIDKIAKYRGDILGRYGGEEFVYVAKTESYKEALELGEQIRSVVEQLDIKYMREYDRAVTVSIGAVYGRTDDFQNMDHMIVSADKKLYEAKSCGRNLVYIDHVKS